MRKTTAYARKVRNNLGMYSDGAYNGATFLNTIQRCRPYMNEPIIGSNLDGTQDACDKAMKVVRDAFEAIKNGSVRPDDSHSFDVLSHALGVTYLRAVDIAGDKFSDNPMLEIWNEANEALRRCRTRRERFNKWEFDKMALLEVPAALEVYETILQASSPAQMTEAADQREAILEAGRAGVGP